MRPAPAALRALIRAGRHEGATAALAPGSLQLGVVVLPQRHAADFAIFCERNRRALPLVAVSGLGDCGFPTLAQGLDLRTDLPRYRIYRDGRLAAEAGDIRALWRDDFVSFALGCFQPLRDRLAAAGLALAPEAPVYLTDIDTLPAGPFAGRLAVAKRMLPSSAVVRAAAIAARYPLAHGAPIHVGHGSALGIEDEDCPLYGPPAAPAKSEAAAPAKSEAAAPAGGEVAAFWASSATLWQALAAARLPLAITHAPGARLIADLEPGALERAR